MPTLLFLILLFYIIVIATFVIISCFRSLKISIISYGKLRTSARFTAKNPIEVYIQSLTVPKQWFKHFYIVGSLWTAFLIIDVIILRKGNKGHFAWFVQILDSTEKYEPEYFKEPVIECIIGLVMFQVQSIRRMYECFFIEKPSVGAKMHVGLYMLGIGNFGILDSKGDWFDHISSAHYTAEIIIYFSFVFLTKGLNLTIWLPFFWTTVCLGIIAKDSEKWGREKFGEEWPKNRWVIMPGIY
ncbi:44637_t:CDS:2 [Gigaspora margarita]|uniref:44637_t:CDS:1 n=1 Tax=Gigaspora margarita TaxID=4874 RepID=A0ABN7V9H7_GIGMA|nr:44637_t:CDS:2 [Gigaspora margarita]